MNISKTLVFGLAAGAGVLAAIGAGIAAFVGESPGRRSRRSRRRGVPIPVEEAYAQFGRERKADKKYDPSYDLPNTHLLYDGRWYPRNKYYVVDGELRSLASSEETKERTPEEKKSDTDPEVGPPKKVRPSTSLIQARKVWSGSLNTVMTDRAKNRGSSTSSGSSGYFTPEEYP